MKEDDMPVSKMIQIAVDLVKRGWKTFDASLAVARRHLDSGVTENSPFVWSLESVVRHESQK